MIKKHEDGSISITGATDIAFARLLALKSALRLELTTGMRIGRRSAFSIVRSEFKLTGSRERVFERFLALVQQAIEERTCRCGQTPCSDPKATHTNLPAFKEVN